MFAPMPEEEADLSLAEFGSHKRPPHFSATIVNRLTMGKQWHAGRDSNPLARVCAHSLLAIRSQLPLRFEASKRSKKKQ
jgi:hypothetical protein